MRPGMTSDLLILNIESGFFSVVVILVFINVMSMEISK